MFDLKSFLEKESVHESSGSDFISSYCIPDNEHFRQSRAPARQQSGSLADMPGTDPPRLAGN
jgi:hypothetical protein